MQKHLYLYAWIFALLVLGILTCLVLIAWMLLNRAPISELLDGAQLVRGVIHHAAV